MIEMILDKYILFVLMGSIAVLGIISKFIVSVTLKRLVRAAGNMNKSNHPLMRLVRAKFEHTCMISEKVENVRVFVDKYLYEYRTVGMKLHSWRRMELAAAGMCLLLGILGGVLEYSVNGMQDMVLRTGAAGAGLAILIFLVHLTTDEGYRLEAVRNYMVDYLENICLHRYEKAYQKEIKVMAPEAPSPDFGGAMDREMKDNKRGVSAGQEQLRVQKRESGRGPAEDRDVLAVKVEGPEREITPPVMPEPYEVSDVTPPLRGMAQEGDDRLSSVGGTARREEPALSRARRAIRGEEPALSSVWGEVPEETEETTTATEGTPEEAVEAPGTAAASLVKAMETVKTERRPREREGKREPAKETAKDLLIRQILEEFMA